MDNLYANILSCLSSSEKGVVALTGGGGKTTFMISFSSFLKKQGKSVLMTTTTKIESPRYRDYGADKVLLNELDALTLEVETGKSYLYAEYTDLDVKKVLSPRKEVLSSLFCRFDWVIVEADGSRQLPMKIHTERDPVIPSFATDVISFFGTEGIGEKAYSYVFGEDREILIDSTYLSSYFSSPEGAMKGCAGKNAVYIANFKGKFDSSKKRTIEESDHPSPLFLLSLKEEELYGIL